MYKTIRHGENSLQYTILPQNDNSLDPENGQRRGNTNRNGIKRKNKSSLLGYIGLFFVCSVVTGAILVPLLVTTDLMPSPATWFIKAQKAREFRNQVNQVNLKFDNNNNINNKFNNINNNIDSKKSSSDNIENLPNAYNIPQDIVQITTTLSTTTASVNQSISSFSISSNSNISDISTIKSSINIQSTAALVYDSLDKNENKNLNINDITTNEPVTVTTVTTPIQTTLSTTPIVYPYNEYLRPIEKSATETPSKIILSNNITPISTIKKENIPIQSTFSVPSSLVLSNNLPHNPSKPKILYQEITSRQQNATTNQTTDYVAKVHLSPSETTKSSDSKNWIKSHWPFVDPSTYFQWAGYDSEDSIILPAILCAALIVVLLLITLCIVARNRKMFVNSIWIRKRSRDSFGRSVANDSQGADDNTTLLVNENASEEE